MNEEDKKTILVVDDDAVIRMAVRNMLKKRGYNVVEAPEGGEGLRKYFEHKPALILCDRMMPEGMAGFEFLEKLRELGTDVPFVFLTSLTDPRDRMAIAGMGVADYLEKPVTVEVLEACLKKILG